MNSDDIFRNLLVDLEIQLRKGNTALSQMEDGDFVNAIQGLVHKTELMSSSLPDDGDAGGGGGGEGPMPDLLGTIQYVVGFEGGIGQKALVLGQKTGDPSTLPNGTGEVQAYQGGVTLKNGAVEPFVIPLANAQAMSPTGVIDILTGSSEALTLAEVTADVSIAPDQTIVLVPRHS